MFDFGLLKKLAGDAEGEIKKLDAQIEKLKRQRDDLTMLPPPREEVRERFRHYVDRMADQYAETARRPDRGLRNITHRPFLDMETNQNVALLSLTTGAHGNEPTSMALCAILREPILEGVDKMLDRIYADNPEVGPHSSERGPMIDKLDRQIADLEAKRADAQQQIQQSLGRLAQGDQPKVKGPMPLGNKRI